ncbi:hypothetical protein DPX16_22523 [Anabarilius grahami]|uniref:Immunoglobulin V-set domain-containing protein n=1 Tax=Anabarilius grahami TaxID=495550 RepID=A0A3N0YYP8_ANAGA|nr:hypothetical protein DPX16_22523 [Anabarilius grahami]
MPCEKSYFISWILRLLLFDVKFIYGLNVCRGDLITNVSLSTELQSEVLLPCSFESDLLKPNRTNESCVVWTHLNTDFVEISLDGEAKFWNNRRGRIETFPKLPESELLDFSIRIRNVQQSDSGVYHCKLFRETNCFLAYKIIDLHKETSDQPYYANSQQGKFSSVYMNRPENKVAIYVNSAAQEEETYANCTDNDYENVE